MSAHKVRAQQFIEKHLYMLRDQEKMAEILAAAFEESDARFAAHTKAVEEFLNELYATLVDPLAEGAMTVAEMKAELLQAARRDREFIHNLPGPSEIAELIGQHETSYQAVIHNADPALCAYAWSCRCGAKHEQAIDFSCCHKKTREHWGNVIWTRMQKP